MKDAILAMSENLDEARLLLVAVANGFDRKSDANFTSFIGILSVPDASLVLRDFRIKDITNPYKCLLKNANFSIKTNNDQITSYITK